MQEVTLIEKGLDKRQARLALLERQMARLQRRIDLLEPISDRYSWARVTIFVGGLIISGALLFINRWLALVIALLTLIFFSIIAHYHGKIDRSITRYRLWQRIKATHRAKMQLNWEAIPQAREMEPQSEHPFEIDLDVTGEHSLHRLLNTAVSTEGAKRLLTWLLQTHPELKTIEERQALVRELTPMTLFRDKLTLKSLLSSRRIVEQLEGDRLQLWLSRTASAQALRPVLLGTIVLQIATLVLFALNFFELLPQYWIFSVMAVLLLFFATANRRGDIFEDATYLRYAFATLSNIFGFLEHYPYGQRQRLRALCEPFFREREYSPSRLMKKIARVASAAVLEKNRLLWIIVNAFIPWDLYCAYRLRQYQAQIAERLPIWLDRWFELEAVCSLATFAYLNPEYTLPEVREGKEEQLFKGINLGHPLLPAERKVTNSFTIKSVGDVVIITGSNMSGKSTFLRTLGVNLCLAYAGAPVNASQLQTVLFRIFTCIRVSDSVTEGYSYFYAEVRRLKALLVELDQPDARPLFFLIDEIFKGTNNRERLIGSRAYVQAVVNRNCVGLISTHDLELVNLAEILLNVSNYHFREDVVEGKMVFDYLLHTGPCPTTNALKIMQLEGLPVRDIYEP